MDDCASVLQRAGAASIVRVETSVRTAAIVVQTRRGFMSDATARSIVALTQSRSLLVAVGPDAG